MLFPSLLRMKVEKAAPAAREANEGMVATYRETYRKRVENERPA